MLTRFICPISLVVVIICLVGSLCPISPSWFASTPTFVDPEPGSSGSLALACSSPSFDRPTMPEKSFRALQDDQIFLLPPKVLPGRTCLALGTKSGAQTESQKISVVACCKKKRDLDSSRTGTMNTNRTMHHGAIKPQGNQSNRNPEDFCIL